MMSFTGLFISGWKCIWKNRLVWLFSVVYAASSWLMVYSPFDGDLEFANWSFWGVGIILYYFGLAGYLTVVSSLVNGNSLSLCAVPGSSRKNRKIRRLTGQRSHTQVAIKVQRRLTPRFRRKNITFHFDKPPERISLVSESIVRAWPIIKENVGKVFVISFIFAIVSFLVRLASLILGGLFAGPFLLADTFDERVLRLVWVESASVITGLLIVPPFQYIYCYFLINSRKVGDSIFQGWALFRKNFSDSMKISLGLTGIKWLGVAMLLLIALVTRQGFGIETIRTFNYDTYLSLMTPLYRIMVSVEMVLWIPWSFAVFAFAFVKFTRSETAGSSPMLISH